MLQFSINVTKNMSRYGMGVVDGNPSGDGDGGMGRGVGACRVWEYP